MCKNATLTDVISSNFVLFVFSFVLFVLVSITYSAPYYNAYFFAFVLVYNELLIKLNINTTTKTINKDTINGKYAQPIVFADML